MRLREGETRICVQFDEAVQYLLSLGHETLTIKLGLRNTELLLHALDNPERTFPAVQIAGTNGKGSTATMLDSICRAAGIKTGLYTSPHLVSITERIKLAGVEISAEDFAHHTTVVRSVAEDLLVSKQIEALPTFFEQLTAVALLAFREAKIDLAILETGLGGRLDSTTGAKAGVVGITPIAMDHENYLGHTLQSIAGEKAATIRPGVTAVIAKQEPEALAVLLERCAEVGVKPLFTDPPRIIDVTSDGRFCVMDHHKKICLGLRGEHQIENASLAIRLAETLRFHGFAIADAAIVSGIETAQHPGRLELVPHNPAFLLDGAHNPAGAASLRKYLEGFGRRPLTLIFGAMSDKKLERIGEILFPLSDNLILTAIDNPRTAPLDVLQPIGSRFAGGSVIETHSSNEALETAIARTSIDGLICITGSLYLIGEMRPGILRRWEEAK